MFNKTNTSKYFKNPQIYLGIMMKNIAIVLCLAFISACSSNQAKIESSVQGRQAVEQRALTSAMEDAFSSIDFTMFEGYVANVQVQGLTERDLQFVQGYVENRILSVGGQVTKNIEAAEYQVNLVLNVIGGDRVGSNYFIFSTERIVGEFSGRFTVVDNQSNVLISVMLSAREAERLR